MDTIGKTTNVIDKKYALKAMDYVTYTNMVTDLLAENKVTGTLQSDALVAYSRLNLHRMRRIEKTIQLLPETMAVMERLDTPQTWLVLTEGWCGDAAQIVPTLHAMALLNANVQLLILLRDENLDLMDQYLTNGTSRSIPKLIVYNSSNNEELFNWGPRPAEIQSKFSQMIQEGLHYEQIKEEVHRWYARDHTFSTQKEITSLLAAVNL